MGRHFINHRTCPECGHRLRHYYFYCGRCGNVDIIDWVKTVKVWLLALFLTAVIILPLLIKQYQSMKAQCQNNQFIAAMMAGVGLNCTDGTDQ